MTAESATGAPNLNDTSPGTTLRRRPRRAGASGTDHPTASPKASSRTAKVM